jgi:hypothetical protein
MTDSKARGGKSMRNYVIINNLLQTEEGVDVFGEVAEFEDLEAVVAGHCGCGCGDGGGCGQGA